MKETEIRFTTQALVIKETNTGESDRLVTLFTRNYGLIRAFASGAKNIKSKKAAATTLLTYGSFTVLKKKDTYKIYEATPIHMFFEAGNDIKILALSQYFCELGGTFAEYGDGNDEIFRLILNSLYFLTEEKRYPPLIKAITELRLATVCGYMPDLVACSKCGKFEDRVMYFDLLGGELYCDGCKQNNDRYGIVDATVLSAMRHIVYSEFKKLYSFTIPENRADVLSKITGRYITAQTEHRFSTLDFYNSIKE